MAIKKLREQQGISVKDVSKKIDVSESYMYQIERGDKVPSVLVAKKIADCFKVTINELFFDN